MITACYPYVRRYGDRPMSTLLPQLDSRPRVHIEHFFFLNNIIFNWNLCKACRCLGLMFYGNVQFDTLFPKPDMALSNWKSSWLDLLAPLGSQNNKFYCFITTAVQFITPCTHYHSLLPLSNIRWEHNNCQFPKCRYNTLQ